MPSPTLTTAALTASFNPVTPASIIAVGAVLPSLAVVAVSLRFYVRIKKRIDFSLDTWNMMMLKLTRKALQTGVR